MRLSAVAPVAAVVVAVAVGVPLAISDGRGRPRPLWSADYALKGFRAWSALDGNTSTPELRNRYFSVVPDPAGGHRKVFKATVDQDAVGEGTAGQRSLLEMYTDSEHPARSLTGGVQGQERWYHMQVYFPADFRPARNTDWNWLIVWHNWPDGPCCANLALTVDTDPTRGHGQRLVLRLEGGGTPQYPVDHYAPYPKRNPTTHDNYVVGDRHLQRRHWYDILMHVVWDNRPSAGFVEWWLDGKQIVSRHTSTLYWYADGNEDLDGAQPGPGQAYLELGYYRDNHLLNGRIDRSTMSVYHADDAIGRTRRSVGG